MWAKLDDHYYDNPKILSVSIQARWIHTAAICWCAANLTDGRIPKRQAWKLGAEDENSRPGEWIQELVQANLFEPSGPDAFRVHDYLAYNPSKAQVLEQREEHELRRKEFLEHQKAAGEARVASIQGRDGGRFTSRTTSRPTSQATSRNDQPAGDAAGDPAGKTTSRPTSLFVPVPVPVPVNPLTVPVPEKDSRPTLSAVSAAADASPPVDNSAERDQEIQAVYAHYLTAMGKTEAVYHLTPKRRAKIKKRLETWDVAGLCAAIDACAASDFHMGGNGDSRMWNDLADHILRSDEKVEGWIYGRAKR